MSEVKEASKLKQVWWKIRSLWPSVVEVNTGFGKGDLFINHYDVVWLNRKWLIILTPTNWERCSIDHSIAYIKGQQDAKLGKTIPAPIAYNASRVKETELGGSK